MVVKKHRLSVNGKLKAIQSGVSPVQGKIKSCPSTISGDHDSKVWSDCAPSGVP